MREDVISPGGGGGGGGGGLVVRFPEFKFACRCSFISVAYKLLKPEEGDPTIHLNLFENVTLSQPSFNTSIKASVNLYGLLY